MLVDGGYLVHSRERSWGANDAAAKRYLVNDEAGLRVTRYRNISTKSPGATMLKFV